MFRCTRAASSIGLARKRCAGAGVIDCRHGRGHARLVDRKCKAAAAPKGTLPDGTCREMEGDVVLMDYGIKCVCAGVRALFLTKPMTYRRPLGCLVTLRHFMWTTHCRHML